MYHKKEKFSANIGNMKKSKPLIGHRAVVTGASSGIGKEYARQLAKLGSNLVIVARRLDRLETLATELKQAYEVDVQCIQLDLCTRGAAEVLFDKATVNGQEVTILINNAGLGKYGGFLDFPFEDHHSTLQVNAITPTETTYLFVRHMLSHKKPSFITQVASIAAFQPVGYFTVYSGSKGYMRYFSETLAFELRKTNIRVLCLCPGGTYTEFFEHSGQKITASGHAAMMKAEDVVRSGIKAMLKGKTVCTPGVLNKIACFFPRILPRNLGLFLAFKTMSRAVERANT
jgi:short-subunit dehydrogenase